MPKVARYVQEAGPMLYSSNEIRKTEKTELFVKIWKVCSSEFKVNFLFFGVLVILLQLYIL